MFLAFKEAIEMNVQGLLAIQRSQHREAFQCFNSGLGVLLDEQPEPTADVGVSSRMEKDKKVIVSVPLTSEERQSPDYGDEIFGLFDRGLHLQLSPEDIAGNQQFYNDLATAVLSYNSGLSHHLFGLQSGKSRPLLIALDFYSAAYASLTSRKEFQRKLPQSVNLALLALANNIGHIHAFFRSLRKTAICSEEICLRLSAILPSVADEQEAAVFGDEYKVFYLNIYLFHESDFAPAPAA